jgi:Holliday junction DNA helicase RuvA
LPFANEGQTYTTLFYGLKKSSAFPEMGFAGKHFNYSSAQDILYYHVPTPLTELYFKTVMEQGQSLDAFITLNTSENFNFSLAYKGLRMIGRLTGTLYDKTPPRIGLDVQGVGYEIDVSMTTFYALPELGAQVTLLTHLTVREDAHILFGFSSAQERATFRELVKVSGIGARTALAVLSGMTADELSQAITLQDPARLMRVPGIGKKTAERLLLEMKGKLGADLGHSLSPNASSGSNTQTDVMHALTALGYSERESLAAVKGLPEGLNISDAIRQALKGLSK